MTQNSDSTTGEALAAELHVHQLAAANPTLGGSCGYCGKSVRNDDPDHEHRVTPILQGGRGVECRSRGDFG